MLNWALMFFVVALLAAVFLAIEPEPLPTSPAAPQPKTLKQYGRS